MCEITLAVENNRDLLMTVALTTESATTNIENMREAFKSSAYAEYALINDAIEQLFKDTFGKVEDSKPTDKIKLSKIIASALDATLSASISDDAMSATLHLKTAQGGRHINYADVIQCLKKNGIIKGINKKNICKLVSKSLTTRGGKDISVEVAIGQHCEDGNDGYIAYLVEDPMSTISSPKKIGYGKVDMRELGGVIYVKKGTKLAKLVPPTHGNNGVTVTGSVIKANTGDEFFIEEMEGSSFIDESKTALFANTSGMPKHLERSVSVCKLLEIDNLDIGTGNIRFDGSIFIRGNVCESMKLYATGDVIIAGLVESAQIKAKGDICIGQGIIGHQIIDENDRAENSADVQARGDINAQFVQYANISSLSNISIEQYISHSQVIVEGDLWVGKREKAIADGKLFGSCIQAGASIFVGILGSPSRDKTSIDLNYWADRLIKSKENTHEKLTYLTNKTVKISALIKRLKDNKSSDKELCLRLDNALKQHLVLLMKYNKNMLEQENKALSHLQELEVTAYKSIFTGVDITITDKTCCLKRDYDATSINWKNKNITFEPIIVSP